MRQNEKEDVQADGCCGSTLDLDCSLTVNGVLATYPSTFRVFNHFGVDLCCTGSLSIEDAAQAGGIDAVALCGALREATFI